MDSPAAMGATLYVPWDDLRRFEDTLWVDAVAWGGTEAQAAQVASLNESLTLVQHRYENGLASYLEVLDAQRSLFNAALSLARAQALQLSSGVRLYKALGGPWSELGTARE